MLATHLFIKRYIEELELIKKPWCNVLSIQRQLLLLLDGSRLHPDSLKSMWIVQFPGMVQEIHLVLSVEMSQVNIWAPLPLL